MGYSGLRRLHDIDFLKTPNTYSPPSWQSNVSTERFLMNAEHRPHVRLMQGKLNQSFLQLIPFSFVRTGETSGLLVIHPRILAFYWFCR